MGWTGLWHRFFGWRYLFDLDMVLQPGIPKRYSIPYRAAWLGVFVIIRRVTFPPEQIGISAAAVVVLAVFGMIMIALKSRNLYQVYLEKHDPVTKAMSYGALGTLDSKGKLANLFKRIAKGRAQMTGIFVSINGFKEINLYSHAVGDRVLRKVTLAMQEQFGENNVYRILGKSFVILQEGASALKAQQAASLLEQTIRHLEIDVREEDAPGGFISPTVTVIVSPVHEELSDRSNFLADVDHWINIGDEATDALKGRATLAKVAEVPRGRPGRDEVPDHRVPKGPLVATLKHVRVQLPTFTDIHGEYGREFGWDVLNLEHLVASICWAKETMRDYFIDPITKDLPSAMRVQINGKMVEKSRWTTTQLKDGDYVQFLVPNPSKLPALARLRDSAA